MRYAHRHEHQQDQARHGCQHESGQGQGKYTKQLEPHARGRGTDKAKTGMGGNRSRDGTVGKAMTKGQQQEAGVQGRGTCMSNHMTKGKQAEQQEPVVRGRGTGISSGTNKAPTGIGAHRSKDVPHSKDPGARGMGTGMSTNKTEPGRGASMNQDRAEEQYNEHLEPGVQGRDTDMAEMGMGAKKSRDLSQSKDVEVIDIAVVETIG